MNGKCPNCTHSSKQGGSTTPCDGCKAEVHLTCVGLSSDDIRVTRNKSKSIKILCNICNTFMGELGEFKSLLTSMREDFKKQFSSLEDKVCKSNQTDIGELKKAIENLQKDFNDLKGNKSNCNTENMNTFEDIVQEITERDKRKCNLILFGVSEQQGTSEDRMLADKTLVTDVLNTVNITPYEANLKPIRLGKYTPEKTRPIKVTLESENQVLIVIKKARELRNMDRYKLISFSLDRTPKQIEYYREVRKSLDERKRNGETDIRIKYVNGIPKIVRLNA